MKISILLITYNHSAYIQQCIESIKSQNVHSEIELIVADDCSKDDTVEKIRSALNGYRHQVTILDTPKNLGFVKNYQRGFAACSGSYIAVMEGDDYWVSPNRLQMHIDFLEQNQLCVLSMNRYISYLETERRFMVNEWLYKDSVLFVTGQDMALDNRLGNMSACVFRKSAVANLKEDIYKMLIADWMIGMALCEHGLIAILNTPTSVYRIHSKGQYSGITEPERLALMNKHLTEYDQYLGGKYHNEFEAHRKRLNDSPPPKARLGFRDFIPPIAIAFIKFLTPRALTRRMQ